MRKDIAFRIVKSIVSPMLSVAYGFRSEDLENVPREGGAVLVCNHVSFIDWLFVGVALPRVPRFVMHQHHFQMPAFRWFFELFEVIPIAPRKEDPARLEAAMRAVDEALAKGELVAIFPEGRLTPDGELSEFRPGVERIVASRPVPVVPLALRGLWGSFWTCARGGAPMKGLPVPSGRTVVLAADAPIAPDEVSTDAIRARIAALRGDAR
jgi:1-acyl-sn-glycerol-3-phosphate acyltransferase